MDDTTTLLLGLPLFAGMDESGLNELFSLLRPVRRRFPRTAMLLEYGQVGRYIGIVLDGKIEAYRPLPAGGRIPMASMGRGGVFGDVLGGAGLKSPVTVAAAEPCEVLLLSCHALASPALRECTAYRLFMQNQLAVVSRKYFALFDRMEVLTMPSLRAKIASYLLAEASARNTETFCIEGTRAWLAEYLSCDRSALSREISHMQADGLISVYKNSFKLLDKAALERSCRS